MNCITSESFVVHSMTPTHHPDMTSQPRLRPCTLHSCCFDRSVSAFPLRVISGQYTGQCCTTCRMLLCSKIGPLLGVYTFALVMKYLLTHLRGHASCAVSYGVDEVVYAFSSCMNTSSGPSTSSTEFQSHAAEDQEESIDGGVVWDLVLARRHGSHRYRNPRPCFIRSDGVVSWSGRCGRSGRG